MNGNLKFWLGIGMVALLIGVVVWTEANHNTSATLTKAASAPAKAAAPAQTAPAATPAPGSSGPGSFSNDG